MVMLYLMAETSTVYVSLNCYDRAQANVSYMEAKSCLPLHKPDYAMKKTTETPSIE